MTAVNVLYLIDLSARAFRMKGTSVTRLGYYWMGFWQQVYLKKVAQILCNFWAFLEGITFQIKKLSAATFWATLAIVGQLFNLTSGHTKLKELWHKNTNSARAQVPLCAIPVWARALVSECGSRARRHSSVPTTRQDGIMRERDWT